MSHDVVIGRRPVLEALRAGRTIRRIVLADAARREGPIEAILALAESRGVPVERSPGSALERLAAGENHQGVIALAEPREPASLEGLLAIAASRNEPPFLLLLDHVEDPHNLGAVLRVADGAGAHGVVVPSRRAAGLSPGAAKASAGAAEWVPVAEVGNLMEAVTKLKKAEVWVGGADAEKGKPYWSERLTGPLALVLGSEGRGLSHPVAKHCDFFVKIPLGGSVQSLNVSTAAAVLCFERVRQVATTRT